MPRNAPSSSVRRPWIATAVQGWGQEIAATLVSFIVLATSVAIVSWGPYFVIGCAVFVLWRRPDIRSRLTGERTNRAATRRIHAALWLCMVVGRDGRIPQVKRLAPTPVGCRYLLLLPIGLHFEAMEARAPELCAALGARQLKVKVVRESARYVELVEITKNAFPKTLRSPLATARTSDLWQSAFFGVGEDGGAVTLTLPEHNLLLGGEPGSGKSVVLSNIVAAAALDRNVSLTLLDGKQVELAPWANVADRFVGPDQADAVSALEELRDVMDARYQSLLSQRRRKIASDGDFGLHVVVVDELAFYLRGGKRDQRDLFAELLRDLVSRGRAAGIIVIAATQKPSHEIVPTWIRDLFAFRLAMRCSSTDASDTILGQGWASRGFTATSIDPSDRGVGLLLAEGGVPVLLKTPYLSDEEIDLIAERALALRATP